MAVVSEVKSGVVLELKNSGNKGRCTVRIRLDFNIGEKPCCSLFYFVFAFLEVFNLRQKNVFEILDISGFRCLLNFEQFVVNHGKRGKFGSKLFSPNL